MTTDYTATTLEAIEEEYGTDLADAIDTAKEIYDLADAGEPVAAKVNDLYLAILYVIPLPRIGAADELISFIQEKARQEADHD